MSGKDGKGWKCQRSDFDWRYMPKDDSRPPPFETDPITLVRRQKQIDYGKNTEEYSNYTTTVPKEFRQHYHPKTPDITKKCSRRGWDGEIRMWRLLLHAYGPEVKKSDAQKAMEAQKAYEEATKFQVLGPYGGRRF